jgi:hypothetical protein
MNQVDAAYGASRQSKSGRHPPHRGALAGFPDGLFEALAERGLAGQLLHDITDPSRYVTIDTWEDEDSYGAFRAVNRQEYSALDQQMEALTESEKRLGVFSQL